MINKALKKHLLKRSENSNLNFSGLVEFLENSEYQFSGAYLRGAAGLAIKNKGYFNIKIFEREIPQFIFFVILHEYCHIKRIDVMSEETMITYLTDENQDRLCDHVIGEEILADRFASLLYYHFNKEIVPKYITQELDDDNKKRELIEDIKLSYGMVKDIESYHKLIEHVVINELD